MRYMGSKRQMLQNGLADILGTEAKSASRVVDLFSGSAAVSWFAASTLRRRVLASDLQEYACVLARAVVGRTSVLPLDRVEREWLNPVMHSRAQMTNWNDARRLDRQDLSIESWSAKARAMCTPLAASDPIWTAYGGHYFSPTQALTLDTMLHLLPEETEMREACLAATIVSASWCVAAPGHTAQPFMANATAGKYLREAWCRDPLEYARRALERIAPIYARVPGLAVRENANVVATELNSADLVFVDPPYSAVQYSRFYHVLETVALGKCGRVQGKGRYPPKEERPTSLYSRATTAAVELRKLLEALASRGCRVVLTFPSGRCSNGLSGSIVEIETQKWFAVTRHEISVRFSTLGGNTRNRAARQRATELVLVARPR